MKAATKSPARRRTFAVLGMVMLLMGGHASFAQDLSDETRELLTRANTAVAQQQWLQAEQLLKTAYDKNSSAPEVLRAYADFSERKGGRELLAIAWYRAYLAVKANASDRDDVKKRIESLEQRALATARGLIDRALAVSSNVASSDRPGALITIARAQAKMGNVQAALSTASSARSAAGSNYYGSDPFGSVAETLASVGELRDVEQALQRVEAKNQSEALRSVVYALTSQKRIADAMAFASRTTGHQRMTSYGYIAKTQAEAGDRSGARSSVNLADDAVNRMDQSGRRSFILNLVETASEAGEIEIAKRLLADGTKLFNLNDRNESYNVNSARWHLTKGLIKWGRLAEAEAMIPSVFANNKEQMFAWYRPNVMGDFSEGHDRRTRELIKQNKWSEAEAALAKEPWPGAFGKARLALVQAHLERKDKDMAAAHRVADLTAASLSKTTVADSGSPFSYALNRTYLAAAYNKLGDFAASRRVLDATAATISKLTDPERKKDPLRYIVDAYAALASAALAAKNTAVAKSAAAEIFKLAGQFATAGERAQALNQLVNADPELSYANELAAALPSLPEDYNKQNIVRAMAKAYLAKGQDSNFLAAVSKIPDASTRKSIVSDAVNKRADAKDWTGALTLANAPGISGVLHADIARKMLSAELVKEAAALEPKFSNPTEEADSYFYQLAARQGGNYDVETALKTAFRISGIPRRIDTLLTLAMNAYRVSGRDAARPVVERAIAQFAQLKTPDERASTCNSIKNYFGYEAVLLDDAQDNARRGSGLIGPACAVEALEIPAQGARIDQLRGAISSYPQTLAIRPIMANAQVPLRRVISRLIGEAMGLPTNSREYPVSSATDMLAREGAVESALNLSAFPAGASSSVAKMAVEWLKETGDQASAQRIVEEFVAPIASIKDDYSRDSRLSSAVDLAIALGDFDRALKLASETKSANSRTYRYNAIANAAITVEKFDVALNALDRAKISAKEEGGTGFLKEFAGISARAGDKNAEAHVMEVSRNMKPGDEIDVRNTLVRELLKWKQRDRAQAQLPAIEAALARMSPDDRERTWYYDYYFAGFLGQFGDTARLDKVIASVSLPDRKVSFLVNAANGFVEAGRNEVARVAIGRALEVATSIADPVKRATALQQVASAYNNAGDAQAARSMLGKTIEAVADIPAPGNKSSRLQSIADDYARLGDVDQARTLLSRSLEVLQIRRPDFEAWADYRIAINREGKDPADAARRALAVADAHLQALAIQSLLDSRISSKNMTGAIALVRSARPSRLIDMRVMRLVRYSLGKRDSDTARALIAQISHAALRDDARRQVLLFQARQGGSEAALADINLIEDKATRAYTLVDLGWMTAVQSKDPRSQAYYFSQLAFFVASKLVADIPELETKVDVLASVAHGQEALDPDVAATTFARAEGLAADLSDARARIPAVRWVKRAPEEAVTDSIASEERNDLSYMARRDDQKYTDVEGFVQSLATKNPGERINYLTNAAGDYVEFLRDIKKKLADYDAKRKSAMAR